MRACFLTSVLLAASVAALPERAASEPARLAGSEIERVIKGGTLRIDTPIGTQVPVNYAADGTMTGKAGAVSFYLGSDTDRGRWWIKGNALCHKWKIWFGGAVNCITMERDRNKITWKSDDGDDGTATLVAAPVAVAAVAPPAARSGAKEPTKQSAREPAKEPAKEAPKESPKEAAPASNAAPPTEAPTSDPADAAEERNPMPEMASGPPTPLPSFVIGSAAAATLPPRTEAPAPTPAPSKAAAPEAADIPLPVRAPPSSRSAIAVPRPGLVTASATSYRVAGVAEGDVLWVRLGPSMYHRAVGYLSDRARRIEVIGPCAGEWCPIRHPRGVSGWVNRWYLVAESH